MKSSVNDRKNIVYLLKNHSRNAELQIELRA